MATLTIENPEILDLYTLLVRHFSENISNIQTCSYKSFLVIYVKPAYRMTDGLLRRQDLNLRPSGDEIFDVNVIEISFQTG
jgi:hypothetical protein